jgi:hypothetical protein
MIGGDPSLLANFLTTESCTRQSIQMQEACIVGRYRGSSIIVILVNVAKQLVPS